MAPDFVQAVEAVQFSWSKPDYDEAVIVADVSVSDACHTIKGSLVIEFRNCQSQRAPRPEWSWDARLENGGRSKTGHGNPSDPEGFEEFKGQAMSDTAEMFNEALQEEQVRTREMLRRQCEREQGLNTMWEAISRS